MTQQCQWTGRTEETRRPTFTERLLHTCLELSTPSLHPPVALLPLFTTRPMAGGAGLDPGTAGPAAGPAFSIGQTAPLQACVPRGGERQEARATQACLLLGGQGHRATTVCGGTGTA